MGPLTFMRPEEGRLSPKRRFLSALFGGRVDRPALGNPTSVATVESMDICGAKFPEANLDPMAMALLAETGHTIFGFDSVMPVYSTIVEAAALGCEIDWGTKDWLAINRSSPWQEPEDVHIPDDFLERQPTKAVLQCIQILRQRLGDRVAIIGKVMGPWTMGYHMTGVQEFLIDVLMDPDRVRAFLWKLLPIPIIFGKAQIAAGADVLMVADHTTGDLVRAETYRDFLLPVHKVLFRELGCPTILHCCGKTLDRMEYFAQSGVDCYHFESANDAKKAVEIVNNRIRLAGNINDPHTILNGTPEEVRLQTLYAMDAGVAIVGPECAIPAISPNRNMLAIYEAAEEWYRVRILEGSDRPFEGLESGEPPIPAALRQAQAEQAAARAAAMNPGPGRR